MSFDERALDASKRVLIKPDDCLPADGPLRAWVDHARALTHAPPIFHLAAMLPTISYEACCRGFILPSYYGAPVVWMGVVGPAGSAKSTAIRWAREFTRDFYRSVNTASYVDPYLSIEGSHQGVMEELPKHFRESVQRTAAILHHSEFSKIIRQEDMAEVYCALFDQDDVDRKYRWIQKKQERGEKVEAVIKQPTVPGVFSVTGSSLERVSTAQHVEGGLFSRILWVLDKVDPDAMQLEPKLDLEGRKALLAYWHKWMARIDEFFFTGGVPLILLESQSRGALEGLFHYHIKPLVTYGDDRQTGFAMRAITHCIRIAAIYALSRAVFRPSGEQGTPHLVIDIDDMKPAANLARWCLERALGMSETLAVDPVTRLQHKVLDYIKHVGEDGCTKGDLYSRFNVNKRNLDPALDALEESNEVVCIKQVTGKRGRPPVRYYWIETKVAKQALGVEDEHQVN